MNERKKAYITFCEQTPQLPLFLQPWWLDVVTQPDGKTWDVVLARNKQGAIEAVFPYLYGCKFGIRYALIPQLTQYTGLWIVPKEGISISQRLIREKQLQNEIIRQLKDLHLSYFDVKFPLSYTNWLPFYWAGYTQETHYTYRIEDIRDSKRVFEQFDYAKQKQIRKAQEAGIVIDYEMTSEALYELQCQQWAATGHKNLYSRALICSLVNASRDRGQGLVARAKDAAGNTHAAVFAVWDGQSAWELISAIHPDYRASGASTLVVWDAMQHVAAHTKAWDFEGSMIEGVENSFRQFGGVPTPYFEICKKTKLLSLIELCKR